MKICRLFLAVPFVTLFVLVASGADDLVLPEKIFPQLDNVLKSAVQQSPRMLNRVLDLEIAENNRIQARAGLLPAVGGSVRFLQSWDDRSDLNGRVRLTKTYYDFSVTQPVYHWGEKRNTARIGEIQGAIARGNFREGYRLLCQELRGGYMGLIAQKLYVKRSQFFLGYANSQLAQAEDRLTKKVISEAEIFPVRLAAEQAQIGFERATFDYANAKAAYARLSGQSEITDESIPDNLPSATYSPAVFDGLLAGYLAQKDLPTVDAVNMRSQLEVLKLNYENQKTTLRPKFNFVAGANQDEQSFTINVAQKYKVNSLYAGVSANWAIFDGFSSRSAARSSLARRRQAENDYRILTEQLTTQAQSQIKNLNFAARSMSISDRSLESGLATLNARKEERNRGVRSEAEVSLAQISYYDAQLAAFSVRSDFLLKTSEFLGTIVEDPVLANVVEK